MLQVAVLAALLLAAASPQGALAAKLGVACEELTNVEGCVECATRTGGAKCFACNKNLGPRWDVDGTVTQCVSTAAGNAAIAASTDPYCARSDGDWCIECKTNFFFNAKFACVTSTATTLAARRLEICRKTSNNPDCAACSPDGACTRCRSTLILVPLNAIFINAGWRDSKCMTPLALNVEAKNITWANAVLPTGCIEVDSDFRCNRCKDGQSLVGGKCVPDIGCTRTYKQYCARVGANGACAACNGARSVVAGECRLPCKQLYGIGCRRCSTTVCTERDPAYANGRRR